MPIQTKPFDDSDDFENLADRLRRDVAGLVLTMQNSPVYRGMQPRQQIEVVITGLCTGLVGACFAYSTDGSVGRDHMMKVIHDYLPQAREHAEALLSE